jgi:hypothetical protein
MWLCRYVAIEYSQMMDAWTDAMRPGETNVGPRRPRRLAAQHATWANGSIPRASRGSVPLRRCCSVRDTDSSLDPSGCVALHGGPVGAALHNDIIAALAHHQHHER